MRDVSERKALTEALAKERDALATVMANTSAQVAYLDDEFRFLLVNDAFAKGSGVERGLLIGRRAVDTVAPESSKLFEQVRSTGEPAGQTGMPYVFAEQPERGTTYWDWRLAPVTGESGTLRGFVLSRADVTDRVRSGIYAEGLSDVLERLGESRDPDELARILAEGVRRVLGADSWSIWEYDGRDSWKPLQVDEAHASLLVEGVSAAEAPFATEAFRTGAVIAVEDCERDSRGRSLVSNVIGARSLIAAPLDPARRPFAALFFAWHGRPRKFTQAEIDFVARAATTTAAAMKDARLYQELSERERFAAALNEISAAITSLLDYDEILRRVVGQAAAALGAESCAVSMLEGGAWVPRYVYALPEDVLGVPIPPERAGYADLGARTKQVVAVDDCEADPRVDPELQRAWGVRAVAMAPLIVRDDVIGGIFFNHHSGPHAFSAVEVQFTANVAAIISGALETARLYEGERQVATTLQEAFVHPLPDVPGLEFAVTAQRAYEPDLVGGDFYDAFDLGDGRIAVLVGDVEGKGVRAAGLTETVRSAVRALSLVDASPGFILGKTNELLLRRGSRQFVTVALVVVEAATGEALYASAGHPPALVLSASSCAELATGTGTPLGAFDWEFEDERLQLRPDDVVLLYTDGLTEVRRRGEQFGVERAVAEACRLAGGSLGELVGGLRDAAVEFGGVVRDDMQIVAFRLGRAARES